MNAGLTLWWGDPNLASQYRADLLQAADRQRAGRPRSARAEQDWRVSRALMQQARLAWPAGAASALSLSHARGHALVGMAPANWCIGVDLEAIRPRDVARLAQWCCSDEEARALARCDTESRRLQAFYQLWTLKECFIKAANLDFPADMRSVGLAPAPRSACDGRPWSGWRLRAPRPGWRAWSAVLDEAWVASVVWLSADTAARAGSPLDRRERTRGAAGLAAGQAEGDTDEQPDGHAIPAWRTALGAASPRIIPGGQWR